MLAIMCQMELPHNIVLHLRGSLYLYAFAVRTTSRPSKDCTSRHARRCPLRRGLRGAFGPLCILRITAPCCGCSALARSFKKRPSVTQK